MQENTTSLKFLKAEIENFKNIESKIINIAGRSLIIAGGNAKSKSSFIQALLSPLDTKSIPPEPIKTGEEKATVKVKIGGSLNGKDVTYDCTVFFTPGNKRGRLLVEREDGEVVAKPATVLKNLVGNISFDIFDFLKLKTERQIEILKELTGKKEEIDLLSMDYKKLYEERTELNRKIKDSEALIAENKYSDDDIDKYAEPVDVVPIKTEMEKVGEALNKYIGGENRLKGFKEELEAIPAKIATATDTITKHKELIRLQENEIEELKDRREVLSEKISSGNTWLSVNARPDSSEILQRLTEAQEHNRHHEKIQELSQKHIALIAIKNEVLEKSDKLEAIEKKKKNIIKKSNIQVEGLTFTDNEVLYNDLPLDTTQINTAKMIEIGMEISMALNPNLRVIFINEGSLLDKESLKTVLASAEKKGYQVIVEVVDFEGGESEIAFTEDFLTKKVK